MRSNDVLKQLLCLLFLTTFGLSALFANDSADTISKSNDKNIEKENTSPWVVLPIVSSNPKVGTSGGAIASYLFKIDPDSTSSMIGVGGNYSTTDSSMGGVFLRSFWDQDRKRFNFFVGGGKINNDYEDFLGSGLPIQTTDSLKLVQANYLQQVIDDWFVGIKGTYTNYLIFSENLAVNNQLNTMGLTGFDSAALGLIVMYDSRNNQNNPTSGKRFKVDNFAYREAFGGEENFDVYHAKYSQYISHGDGHVFAYMMQGRWTSDATPGGYSSVDLRGYSRGQYLAPHATSIEFEERLNINGRYGVNVFAGVSSLYGDGLNWSDSDNLYPSVGLGGRMILNKKEQLAMTFDVAFGKSGNNGFYIRLGQSF